MTDQFLNATKTVPTTSDRRALSPETHAILAAVDCYGTDGPEIAAQTIRALLFLSCARMPIDRSQLHQIADELDQ